MKKTKLLTILSLTILFSGCNAQSDKKDPEKPEALKLLPLKDSTKPDVTVKVNKKYDDKGNIVRYDSSYTYTFKSGNQFSQSSNDSIFGHFKSLFNQSRQGFSNSELDHIFFNDSLFKYDFFNNDYFFKRFELNKSLLDDYFKDMDSMKNNFLERNYPNGHQEKKKEKQI